MDLGASITELVLVAICIAPFIIMGRNKAKSKKQKRKAMTALAHKNNHELGLFEVFGNLSLGMDTNKSQLFFIRKDNNGILEQSLPLSKFKTCVLNKIGTKDYVEKIELGLHTANKKQDDIYLLIFDNQNEFQLNGQLQWAEKWKSLIAEILNQQAT